MIAGRFTHRAPGRVLGDLCVVMWRGMLRQGRGLLFFLSITFANHVRASASSGG